MARTHGLTRRRSDQPGGGWDLCRGSRDKLLRPESRSSFSWPCGCTATGSPTRFGRDPRFRVVGSAASLGDARAAARAARRGCRTSRSSTSACRRASDAARALRAAGRRRASSRSPCARPTRRSSRWAEAGVAGLVSREATLAELLDAVDGRGRRDEVLSLAGGAAALLRRVASLAARARAARRPARSRRASARSCGLIGRRPLEQGDRARAADRGADGQEPRAQHPREAARRQPHRGRRRRARARRARPDLDPPAPGSGSRLNRSRIRRIHSRRAPRGTQTRAQALEGEARWSAPGSCS